MWMDSIRKSYLILATSRSGQRKLCYPRIPFFVTDEKDLTSCVTGMYGSSKANRPCNLCTLCFKGAADITQKGPRRMLAEMLQVKASQYNSEIVPRIQFSCSSDLTGNLQLRLFAASGQFILKTTTFSDYQVLILSKIQVAECTQPTMAFSSAFLTYQFL